jgi:membrane fusion protein (multidrug efflux system)
MSDTIAVDTARVDGAMPTTRAAQPLPVRTDVRRLVRRSALAGLALALAGGASWYGHDWWTVGRFIESTDDAYVGGDVTVIATKVPGFIATIAVTDNQPVKAGDLLATLDDRDYRAALAKAEGAVAAARADLAHVAARRRLQEAVIAETRAEIGAADAEADRSRFDVVRYRELQANQFASAQRFQRADADHKKAGAAAEKARAAAAAAERELDVIDSQRAQAEAALQQAIAERDLARINLGYTELRTPIDGTVGNRAGRVGAYAASGAYLMSVIPAQGLWIDANFKEDQLARMRAGQPVAVVADVLPGRTFHGHVESLAPGTGAVFSVIPPENATGNFTKIVQRVPVRIRLDDADARLGALRPGLSTTAGVDTRPRAPAGE